MISHVCVLLITIGICVIAVMFAPVSVERKSIIVGDILLPLFLTATHVKLQITYQTALYIADNVKTDTKIESGPNKDKHLSKRTVYTARYFYFDNNCCCLFGYPLTLTFFHSNSMKNLSLHYVDEETSEKTYDPNTAYTGGW